MTGSFGIEAMSSDYDRSSFSCGNPALDRYLREQATQDMKRLISSCFVLIDKRSQRVAGYYTLAATSVLAEDLPADTLKKLPRYPVLPAALVGRLAVDLAYKRRGLGGVLLADAALRITNGDVRAFAIVVDAKDDDAAAFYRAQGFLPLASRPMSLFLPLATFRKASSGKA
ncbi:MAG: GNAT family N-acetyltransferase [Rhizobium sp.]|nr:GNAT family N-acetyltransferase [Rhizobium sp.]